MKELGAKAILGTMLFGLTAWFASQVFGNSIDIAKLQIRETSILEHLKEIKLDIKEIRKAVK